MFMPKVDIAVVTLGGGTSNRYSVWVRPRRQATFLCTKSYVHEVMQ